MVELQNAITPSALKALEKVTLLSCRKVLGLNPANVAIVDKKNDLDPKSW